MRLRDRQRESQIIQMRLIWTLVFVVVVLAALVSRMIWLQWVQHDRFQALADQNRVQTQPIAPPRGCCWTAMAGFWLTTSRTFLWW